MAAVLSPPITRTIRHNVSWEEFERLIADNAEGHVRHAYHEGILETTVPSQTHEERIEFFRNFIGSAAPELGVSARGLGSTTIRHPDSRKGFEPDASYYIRNERLVRGKRQIDFTKDPPPDLVIEVDVTNSSMDKLPLFAALRIPEVWRCDDEGVRILVLSGKRYEPQPSLAFPGLDAATLTRFLNASLHTEPVELILRMRQWARDNLVSA